MSKIIALLFSLPGLAYLLGFMAAETTAEDETSIFFVLVVVFVLVIVNGLFVAAEFAIIGVRRSRIEQMSLEGNVQASHVLDVLTTDGEQDQYIATAQLGITVASLGLGMYGEPQVAHFIEPYLKNFLGEGTSSAAIHSIAFVISLSLLTYLHIVIGEMVPKSLALSSAEQVVIWVSRPMRWIQAVLIVPVRVLNAIGNVILRLLRVPPVHGHAHLHSPEELELIVTESAEDGLIHADQQEMILNIFDFKDRQVGQVMTPRRKISALAHDMSVAEVRKFVADSRYSRFPVYKEDLDHIVGVLHVKDWVRAEIEGRTDVGLAKLLRPAPAVPEAQSAAVLLAVFKRQRQHMAIVIDEFGGVAGIVTLEDLAEEIVGEVRDEFDVEKEPFVQLSPGLIEVAGDYLLEDLQEIVYLGNEEKLPDVETVGGLIVNLLGRPPQKGDIYHLEDVLLTILDIDGLAISRARVQYPDPDLGVHENSQETNNIAKSEEE
ncbi:MAG TPA: hemolysin family protein [Anaerolineae bacterium]|nr:hemolysin family protein [Anaerolineae bacterium]